METNNENNNLNGEPTNFGMPKGYFQNSATSIINKIEWMEEHKVFPVLGELKKESGFVVPQNYFNQNETKLELLEFSKLFSLNKTNAFKVPNNYFEELEITQFSNLLVDNKNELQAFENLNAITKQNNFKVSNTYFKTTEEKITAILLNTKKGTKVINLFSSKVWYAAAALLAVALGFWTYSHYYKIVETGDCGTLACVDKVDLVKAKNLEILDNEQLYELVDTKKLEEKLENKKSNNQTQNEDLDTSLKNVSTEDLLDEI